MSVRDFLKLATTAGLVGLAVLHPQSIARVLGSSVDAFRKAVRL